MIGYHYYIARSGEVVVGRQLGTTGAHAKGHNQTIGICLAGGFGSDADDLATDHYTAVQLAAAYDLIRKLQDQYQISSDKVIGHNRVSSKACPGFRVQKWLSGMSLSEATQKKPERTKPAQSKTVKASAVTVAASAGTTITALSGMNETAQYIILGFAGITILFGIYIMKERLKAWAEGWH
jgi:N-acetyl-anhydromuramyl-L-alanine amidase AmpD